MKFTQRPIAAAIAARTSGLGLAAVVLAAAIAFTPGQARAESNFVNGSGTATARLNFSIIIPRFVFLQVGTGTPFASNAAIDTILFDMSLTPAAVGNGTPQAGTGGDLLGGAVTARVLGNNFTAPVNLTATTAGAMSNGTRHDFVERNFRCRADGHRRAAGGVVRAEHPGSLAGAFRRRRSDHGVADPGRPRHQSGGAVDVRVQEHQRSRVWHLRRHGCEQRPGHLHDRDALTSRGSTCGTEAPAAPGFAPRFLWSTDGYPTTVDNARRA